MSLLGGLIVTAIRHSRVTILILLARRCCASSHIFLVDRQSFQEHFVLLLDGIWHDFGGKKLVSMLASRAKSTSHETSGCHELLLIATHFK